MEIVKGMSVLDLHHIQGRVTSQALAQAVLDVHLQQLSFCQLAHCIQSCWLPLIAGPSDQMGTNTSPALPEEYPIL